MYLQKNMVYLKQFILEEKAYDTYRYLYVTKGNFKEDIL